MSSIEYTKKALPANINKIGIVFTVLGLILLVLAYMADHTRGAFNNLILLMFLSSVGVGSVFLVAIEYLGGAVWSTPFRRISEFLGATVILLPLVALPVYMSMHDLYHWTHTEVVGADKILSGKAPYLDQTFFTIRVAAFFVIWILFYLVLHRNSVKQDSNGDQSLTKKNIKLSAIFMPFFAISLTFGSIDWVMSLEPHWFSTIFGVYYFSGTILAALAAGTFLIVFLNEKGYFVKGIVKDHYYSLGAMLFAFINFWAYIAFSQFLLIWYANLPEETFWYLDRWEGSWMYLTIALMVIHFVVPYFGLLSQPSKMNGKRLKFMSLWILFAHFVDMYWLIMPTYSPEGVALSWFELGAPILAVGLIALVFGIKAKNNNIIPVQDPKLKRGLDFRL